MRKLPIPYYDYGPGIRETNESRCMRFLAYTMPTQSIVWGDPEANTPNQVTNYTFEEYKFNFDTGIVTKLKNGEEIDLSVDVTYE